MTLKTLKDFPRVRIVGHPDICGCSGDLIELDKIKAEAIKWVKEDMRRINRNSWESERTCGKIILRKWMIRLNIKEEDLE